MATRRTRKGKTDWNRLERLGDAEIRKAAKADPDAAPVASSAPKPEIKAPAPAQPVIPGTTKKISRLALTIEGKRHDVSVEELA